MHNINEIHSMITTVTARLPYANNYQVVGQFITYLMATTRIVMTLPTVPMRQEIPLRTTMV